MNFRLQLQATEVAIAFKTSVLNRRRVAPEVLQEREAGGCSQVPGATRAAPHGVLREIGGSAQEPATHPAATRHEPHRQLQAPVAQPAISDTEQEASSEDEMQFDPRWSERGRCYPSGQASSRARWRRRCGTRRTTVRPL